MLAALLGALARRAGVASWHRHHHRAVDRRLDAGQPGAHRRGEPAAAAFAAVRHREPTGRQRQHRHGGGGQGGAGRAHAGGEHRRAAGDQPSAVRQDALRDGEGHCADHDPCLAAERADAGTERGRRQRREPARRHQAGAGPVHLRLHRSRLAVASGHGVAGDEGGRDGGAPAVSGIARGGDGAAARGRADGGAARGIGRAASRAGEIEASGGNLAAALCTASEPADAAGGGHRRGRGRRLGGPHRACRHERGGACQDLQGGGCHPRRAGAGREAQGPVHGADRQSPEEFRTVLKEEHDRGAPIIAAGGIKAE